MRSKHTWNSKTHADTRGIIKTRLSAGAVLGPNSREWRNVAGVILVVGKVRLVLMLSAPRVERARSRHFGSSLSGLLLEANAAADCGWVDARGMEKNLESQAHGVLNTWWRSQFATV